MRKTTLYLFALIFFVCSCTKEEALVKINADIAAPVLTNPASGAAIVITKDNLSALQKFEWSASDYGVDTPVTYTIEIDTTGNAFKNAVIIGSSLYDSMSIPFNTINDKLLNTLKVTPNVASTIDIRVTATISSQMPLVSATTTLHITPYKLIESDRPAVLWVPGEYQNWSPGTAPVILATAPNVYEGYVNIKQGSGFKFTNAPDWDHINYGDGGAYGVLTTDGKANSLGVSSAAYYRFKVNTDKLTYEIYGVTNWGFIGTSTPQGWTSSTPSAYDVTADKWSLTLDLKAGALKFRANDSWDVNYGPADSNAMTGTLIQTDAAITIPADGNYTVTLDFSRSKKPYLYTYTVVKN